MSARLKPLHEQKIVIVGASSGIGLATAEQAVAAGAAVLIASRNSDALEEIADRLRRGDGRLRPASPMSPWKRM